MKTKATLLVLVTITGAILSGCCNKSKLQNQQASNSNISPEITQAVTDTMITLYGASHQDRIQRGVSQAAALWTAEDGSPEEFAAFCKENFIAVDSVRHATFLKISEHMEALFGHYNGITLALMRPLHIQGVEKLPVDDMFGSYSASAHFADDMFANKIAFYIILNFPSYNLKEKTELGASWDRKQWAYARLGDMFGSRVPASVQQGISDAVTAADTYISEYNIYMGQIVNAEGKTFFPSDKVLISHWNLRDELKTHYNTENGIEKQRIIYSIMQRIITQEIPSSVINSDKYTWNPVTNKLYLEGKASEFTPEPDTRYQHLKNIFDALVAVDPYSPQYPTYIQRKFDGEMELSQEEVEKLFRDFLSSPQVKEVAALIKSRLGRDLEPFDIWYDGFKPRSSISEDQLNEIVGTKYPTWQDFATDLPVILQKLGFTAEVSSQICSRITVDPSKGAGHAWGSEMKGDNARLRTRVGEKGMDYKGYNIGIHEFGHNVEQTLSLYNVDYYMLRGVPNTSFTEALAFLFQKRDLELLGIKNNDPLKDDLMALDNFWSCYEIMGVSLVDMQVWKWLYDHPDATPAELKESVITIAQEVWNEYYAGVFGSKDEPILAIYSHMIDAPLYLSAYPVGHLIEFQVDKFMADKPFAEEVTRIYTMGRLIPQTWMKQAVGSEISIEPTLKATTDALGNVK